MNKITPGQAERKLNEWINVLGLSGWNIKLIPECKPSSMQGGNAGEVEWVTVNRYAVIRILHKKYHENKGYFDFERTLIHELLHLKFAIQYDNMEGVDKDLLHQTIEDLARALIYTKRARV